MAVARRPSGEGDDGARAPADTSNGRQPRRRYPAGQVRARRRTGGERRGWSDTNGSGKGRVSLIAAFGPALGFVPSWRDDQFISVANIYDQKRSVKSSAINSAAIFMKMSNIIVSWAKMAHNISKVDQIWPKHDVKNNKYIKKIDANANLILVKNTCFYK
ncbi:hypothetical protein [Asticcacaulis excentricus]|uniref:hypothetical protein n=1 Tax=Asticcacaulis excentricus TaxID=78587 RepID=UPI00117E89D2|nr:hypothetical protein [Asticcacaulis excentricus]